jgi:hypothetical protein
MHGKSRKPIQTCQNNFFNDNQNYPHLRHSASRLQPSTFTRFMLLSGYWLATNLGQAKGQDPKLNNRRVANHNHAAIF